MSDYVGIEGIEVLKGPQGTLFGRNTSAGVASVSTAAPSHEAGGTIEVSVGNYSYKQVRASVTGSLVEDKLSGRISGSWQECDVFLDNSVTGAESQNRDHYSIREQVMTPLCASSRTNPNPMKTVVWPPGCSTVPLKVRLIL